MFYDFQTTTHGKWILVGEHAVLRGHGALVFPLRDMSLTLTFQQNSKHLSIKTENSFSEPLVDLVHQVLKHGFTLLEIPHNMLVGSFNVSSSIPAGVGFGASAALCVAIVRWFVAEEHIPTAELSPFARELEHLFHGQSSGLDIAGVSSTEGVYFQQGTSLALQMDWQPHWRLSSCQEMGATLDCIQQVQRLREADAILADTLDEQMHASVELARGALERHTPDSETRLIAAINQANDCFQRWGLVTPALNEHMQQLRNEGALAVKPTGSGGGGMVVSLWPS